VVAVVLVLLAHVAGTRHAPTLTSLRAAGDVGILGVRIFFVISGFLIAVMLEREFDRTGRISLSDFLRRRALRILPAFGVYLGAMAAMAAAGVIALSGRDLLMSATFTMNYAGSRAWYVGHLWSLSVEAQFYAGWAVLRTLAGRSRSLAAAAGGLVAAPAARGAIHLFAPGWRSTIREALPTIGDAPASGAPPAKPHQPRA